MTASRFGDSVPHYTMRAVEARYRHISPTTVIITVTLLIFSAASVLSRASNVNPHNEWDVLIFTQNWPNTVCLEWHEKVNGSKCIFPSNQNRWTIHGIWPTKLGTKGPGFCNPSLPFNPEEIYGILSDLEEAWTPVEKHKKKNQFWQHEWEKHGTCAAVLSPLSTEFKYFAKGLEWSKKYDMKAILDKAGVVPRNDAYDANDIWTRVKNVVGTTPFLMCYTEPKTKLSFLQEIRLCFDKNLVLTNCDGIKLSSGQNNTLIECPKNKPTHYLSSVPKALLEPMKKENPWLTALKTIRFLQWTTL